MATTPTLEDVKEFQKTFLQMDKKTFDLYKQLAYVLITKMPQTNEQDNEQQVMDKQRQFIKETAGKIQVDENAINDLRMRSMI